MLPSYYYGWLFCVANFYHFILLLLIIMKLSVIFCTMWYEFIFFCITYILVLPIFSITFVLWTFFLYFFYIKFVKSERIRWFCISKTSTCKKIILNSNFSNWEYFLSFLHIILHLISKMIIWFVHFQFFPYLHLY